VSDASPPILSYATPLNKALPPDSIAVSFPPPPVRQEVFINTLGLIFSASGGLVLCFIPFLRYFDRRHGNADPVAMIVAFTFGMVVLVFAWSRWRVLRRLRCYDGSPVRIEVRDGATLMFTDPLQPAHRRETILPLASLRKCSAHNEGQGTVARTYRIDFHGGAIDFFVKCVRVAANSGDVVERLVADLNAAIRAARADSSSATTEPDA
jgi:hypothetical protein